MRSLVPTHGSQSPDVVDPSRFPALARIVDAVLGVWPTHEKYLRVNFGERDGDLLRHSEKLAGIITRIGAARHGGLDGLASDYKFLCQNIVLPEELFFRRHGRYRLTSFAEADARVYSNAPFMSRYMNGLLLSDVVWINHCRCMRHYIESFLPSLEPASSLLEIGPGHGLLLHLADSAPTVGKLSAWDVSDASLSLAADTLKIFGSERPVAFEKRNIYDAKIMSKDTAGLYDAVVLSEVLEHLEAPLDALRVLHHITRPGGRVWINVPANSPAPDHLFLVNHPDEAAALVHQAGFDVVDAASYPTSGTTLERAVKEKLTVSCVVVGRKR